MEKVINTFYSDLADCHVIQPMPSTAGWAYHEVIEEGIDNIVTSINAYSSGMVCSTTFYSIHSSSFYSIHSSSGSSRRIRLQNGNHLKCVSKEEFVRRTRLRDIYSIVAKIPLAWRYTVVGGRTKDVTRNTHFLTHTLVFQESSI